MNIYLAKHAKGPVKIGMSASHPKHRLLPFRTCSPWPIELVTWFRVGDCAREFERACHEKLGMKRMNGEWFDVDIEEAIAIIEAVAADLSVEVESGDMIDKAKETEKKLQRIMRQWK